MARPQLNDLQTEIRKYLGLPYFSNVGKFKTIGNNAVVGKGTAREIALKTIELATLQKIKLLEYSSRQIYNFQKKHHLGIDCSGLACHLLNFYFGTALDIRKTSANMLTSPPLSKKINSSDLATGDLIRQENGHHVLFVINNDNNRVDYVHSSIRGRGVRLGHFSLTDNKFKHNGFFRLISPNSTKIPTTIKTLF